MLAQWTHAQKANSATLAFLRYDAGMDLSCTVTVHNLAKSPQSEPREALTITCDGKQLLDYETDDDLIDLSLNYPHVDRVFARWQGGAHVRLSVFKVDPKYSHASTVFDEQLEGAPEVINAPDVLLIERGKRFPEGQAVSLPTSTDVYRWTGEEYELTNRWKWNIGMRIEDRFCVLDVKALSCPVTPLPLK
jgi:hypothetical protein